VPSDPDNWMGIANVYSREERVRDALQALDRAVDLDPSRADRRIARGRALHAANQQPEATWEFQRALELDPNNSEARGELRFLRGEPRHELRVGVGNDLFNFADANHDEEVSLASQWTSHWRTSVGVGRVPARGHERGEIHWEPDGKAV
jgi:tetratricopeptide (TPR) repeat protein